MLAARHLKVWYGATEVLQDVSFEVAARSIVALLGGNGSGKTTILNTLSGLVKLRAGTVAFEDREVQALRPDQRVRLGIVQVPQGREVWSSLSVRDNLTLGAVTRQDKDGIAADFARVLALFPRLNALLGRKAGTLSGGEQQMVAIARALMARPRLLLMDEPSAGLSPRLVGELADTILRLNAEGYTVLLVEQNVGLAAAVAEHAHVLANGVIAFSGPAATLLHNPDVLKSYLGG